MIMARGICKSNEKLESQLLSPFVILSKSFFDFFEQKIIA